MITGHALILTKQELAALRGLLLQAAVTAGSYDLAHDHEADTSVNKELRRLREAVEHADDVRSRRSRGADEHRTGGSMTHLGNPSPPSAGDAGSRSIRTTPTASCTADKAGHGIARAASGAACGMTS
jgi:hypothetical protein